ncbi:MAG: hypothetical protein ABIH65_01815 [Nanoarchaeota archaeon]
METEIKERGIIYESPAPIWQAEKRFVIPSVSYRGKTGNYRLFEQMTPKMSQAKLAELYESEKQKGNPYPTDMPLIWAIATKGYELRNENSLEAEKLRQFLRTGFRQYPNTLTRIIYNPSEKDKIIHNYKTSDEYSFDSKVVGPDSFIDKLADMNVLEQILGTKDVIKINEVSQWINRTNSFIWRLNSKPSQKEERVARFVAYGSRLYLDCDGDPLYGDPAFRVLKVD